MFKIRGVHIYAFLLFFSVILSGCEESTHTQKSVKKIKIGMMLADYGLGDQSFNDTAFLGLMKAREELGIIFDYRDLNSSTSYEQGLVELIEDEKSDLIIGLGHNMAEDFKIIAKKYPNKHFLFIDQLIDLPNVSSVTFIESEGSFLAGIIAGLKTKTNAVGFIGGMDIPVINRFKNGFITGVQTVNPNANISVDYTNDFGNASLGRAITKEMVVKSNIDIIYSAAGFSSLGAIEEASHQGIYAIGVDSDQFFVAEKTVITSMLKNVDVAVYKSIKEFVDQGNLKDQHMELGIQENGVGLAPVRIITLDTEEEKMVETLKEELLKGKISFPLNN